VTVARESSSTRNLTPIDGKSPPVVAPHDPNHAEVIPEPMTTTRSRLLFVSHAALVALLMVLFSLGARGSAQIGNIYLRPGECEWETLFISWCWSTGADCVPGTETEPWRDEGSGTEVWEMEICAGQYDVYDDINDSGSWYDQGCYNWWMYTILFSR
jgi:hypothetical protein